jgi:hypothetical protein
MSLDLTKRKPKGAIITLDIMVLSELVEAIGAAHKSGIASFHFLADGHDLKVLYDEEEDLHFLVLQPVD